MITVGITQKDGSITKRLDVIPGEGLGSIRLGMRPEDVLASMAEPSVFEDWMGGNLNCALMFHGLLFYFDECDGIGSFAHSHLDMIEIHQREDVYLFGRAMGEWTKESVLERLRSRGDFIQFHGMRGITAQNLMDLSFDEDDFLSFITIFSTT